MRKISELTFADLLDEINDAVIKSIGSENIADFMILPGFKKTGLHEAGKFAADRPPQFVTSILLIKKSEGLVIQLLLTSLLKDIEE